MAKKFSTVVNFLLCECIGVGKGGAEGAKAPPTLKLEGLSPPNFMLDGRLVVVNR